MFNPEVKVSFDFQQIKIKPETREEKDRVGKATNNRLARNSQYSVTLEVLAVATSNYHAFAPASFFNRERKKITLEQQQVFALDFDSKSLGTKLTPEQVMQRAKEFQLGFAFAYYSLSSTPETPKFRMVFFTTEPIIGYKNADKVIKALMTIFSEADKACSDCSHFYFGGKERIFADEPKVPMNLQMLADGAASIEAAQVPEEEKEKKNKNRVVAASVKSGL